MDRESRSEGYPEEFGVELGRVQATDVHADCATAIDIGADVFALLGIGYGIRLGSKTLRQSLGAPGHHLILFISECTFELANALKIALEPFRLDEVIEEFARDLTLGLNRDGLLFAVPRGSPFARIHRVERCN